MVKEIKKQPIINCHIHTFTLDHVPLGFLPFSLGKLARVFTRFPTVLAWILRKIQPFSDTDVFDRYAAFVETSSQKSQEKVFEEVRGFYPDDSKFIILPMDTAYMGAGVVPVTIAQQHRDLEMLAGEFGDRCLPFYAVDPRRYSDANALAQNAIQDLDKKRPDGSRVFRGIKIYPPLGFSPEDHRLMELYAFCQDQGLPIMTHCSRGGVHSRKIKTGELITYTDPDSYRSVLKRFPKLKVCLAHMGGNEDWQTYFTDPESRKKIPLDASTNARAKMNWLTKITQMIESEDFENLYTDISYTVFEVENFLAPLAVILRGSEKVRSRTLFGSDYYMTHNEEFDERFLSMKLRHALGEDLFDQIARKNPKNYLG